VFTQSGEHRHAGPDRPAGLLAADLQRHHDPQRIMNALVQAQIVEPSLI